MPAVVDVTDYAAPYGGNFIPSLVAVGNAVRERLGLDYRCVFTDPGSDWLGLLDDAEIPYDFLDPSLPLPRRAVRLRELAERRDAALLRSHFTTFDPDCAWAGRRLGARVVWHSHTGIMRYGLRVRAGNLLKVRMLGRMCDRLVAVSEELGRVARARGYPPDKVTVVPNGIAFERYAPDRMPDPDHARAELGLAPADVVLLSFCWDAHRKGADVIVDAVGALPAETGVTALLVGGQPMREYVGGHLAEAELPATVRLLDPVPDSRALYAAADVFVSASREDAFSYAIGEAMGAGLPVISSDIPGPRHFLSAPGALTFPTEDVPALRTVIEDLASSADRRRLGQENRAFALERFGMDRHVDGVLAVFEELLGAG